MLMGKYRFRLSDMMPNAWFYKLRDMTHGARNNPNHHHHQKKKTKKKKKRRPSNSSAPTPTSASNATSAAPSHIVPRLSNPTYNNKLYHSHSPRLSDLYSPRNHKASDIPLPPPTPSSPTSRISSSPPPIILSKRSKSRKSLGHMPSPSPTRRPLQQHHHQEEEVTITPPTTTSTSLVTSTNACNHHHMHYYSLSASSPRDSSSLWGKSNSYCHHCHNNNNSSSSSIYGLVSSDEEVDTGRSSGSCRVSSSTADVIIDLNMDQNSFTNAELQLVSEPLDHELNSPTILIDPAAIFNAYHDENNSSTATAGSRTGTMITTTTTTTTTTTSRKSSCSKGRQFEDIESGGGPSSSSSSSQQQLSVRINYVRSEERNISSSSKRSCKESAVNSNIDVSSCSKYSSRSSRAVTVNTSAPPAAGPGGIRGVKLRLGTKTPRLACNKKVVQAQSINGTRKSIILSANSPRRRKGSKNSKSTRRSSSSATTVLSDSFAVVKSSCDPQRDFRESMTEMIVENNIRASRDLEDLLACYLTLNSNHYHQLILKAFEQIWFHMFYDDDPSITDLH